MCDMGAVSAGGNIFTSSIQAGVDATSKEMQATQEAQASAERANRIRMRGQTVLAEQRLQTLANGVEGGSGSALEVGGADAAQLELDAMTEIYRGKATAESLRQSARLQRENSTHGLMSKAMRGVNDLIHGAPIWNALGVDTIGNQINKQAHNKSNEAIWGFHNGGSVNSRAFSGW